MFCYCYFNNKGILYVSNYNKIKKKKEAFLFPFIN